MQKPIGKKLYQLLKKYGSFVYMSTCQVYVCFTAFCFSTFLVCMSIHQNIEYPVVKTLHVNTLKHRIPSSKNTTFHVNTLKHRIPSSKNTIHFLK